VIAAEHDATPAQVAIAWVLTKSFVSSVLLGANTLAQFEDNLRAAAVRLGPEEIAMLDEFTSPTPIYPNYFNARVVDEPLRQALLRKA
jgi:aryl-alcohol dehydrogenase-like predicted oxidoreductase